MKETSNILEIDKTIGFNYNTVEYVNVSDNMLQCSVLGNMHIENTG